MNQARARKENAYIVLQGRLQEIPQGENIASAIFLMWGEEISHNELLLYTDEEFLEIGFEEMNLNENQLQTVRNAFQEYLRIKEGLPEPQRGAQDGGKRRTKARKQTKSKSKSKAKKRKRQTVKN